MLKEFFDNALADLYEFKEDQNKRNGQRELRDKWNENPHTFRSDPDQFYRDMAGDSYLYDLATWHSSKTIYRWGQLVHRFAKGQVWDFGAGIGTYSLLAAASPLTSLVYYDDINPENQAFSEWRFKKYGFADKVYIGAPQNKIDTIICLDVIEHLTDPHRQIDIFNAAVNSGAIIIINITAHTSKGEHPMHLMDTMGARKFWHKLEQDWRIIAPGDPSAWQKL